MDDTTKLLIIGKTGNGKSSLGNSILGHNGFKVTRGLASTTRQHTQAVGVVNGEKIKVIDTPDPVNLNLRDEQITTEVALWKSIAAGKFSILLAVRCDVRYTAEEYDIYKKIKRAWRDNSSFEDHLVVVFTFGDRQDRDIEEELRTVCRELRSVLDDARDRYVLFSNKAQGEARRDQVRKLQQVVRCLHDQGNERRPVRQQQEVSRSVVVFRDLNSPRSMVPAIFVVVVVALFSIYFYYAFNFDPRQKKSV